MKYSPKFIAAALFCLLLIIAAVQPAGATWNNYTPYKDGIPYRISLNDNIDDIYNGTGTGFTATSVSALYTTANSTTNGNVDSHRRAVLIFNTTGSCTPQSGSQMCVWVPAGKAVGLGSTNFGMMLVNATTGTTTSVTFGDYSKTGHVAESSALAYSSITTGSWQCIPLNSAGLSYVNTTGNTTFGLVDSWDGQLSYASNAVWGASAYNNIPVNLSGNLVNIPSLNIDCSAAPPAVSIQNLTAIAHNSSVINVTWGPYDSNYAATQFYVNNVYQSNITTPTQYFKTGTSPLTQYNFSTRTVDILGNINSTWVNTSVTTPLKITGSSYSFFHLGDTQDLSEGFYPVKAFNLTFQDIEELKSDYNLSQILITGDLVNGIDEAQYKNAANAQSWTSIPIHAVTGNHDVMNNGSWVYWDKDIPNGPSMHDYGFTFNDFAVYGLAWNGTTGSSGDIGLNATAKAQMITFFNQYPTKSHIVLEHAYTYYNGDLVPAGQQIWDSSFQNTTVLSGHDYPPGAIGNIMNQTVYNNTVFTNDMWDEQDIYDAKTGVNDYTGGRMYTVWYKGTELMVNTSDMYFYPQYVVNNTQTFDLGPMVPTSSFSVNVTPSGNIPNTPVQFTDTSTNGPVIAWAWSLTDFSNATITPYVFSTLQNPVNTFGTGNFSISLAITTSKGTFTSAQNTWINVSAGIPRSGISTSTNYSFVQSDNIYNVPVDMLAIDPRTPAWINNITDTAGANMYMDRNIPYNYVDANITKSNVILTYPYSSTGALMPIPDNALVEAPTFHDVDHEVYFFDPDEGYMGDGYNSTPPRQPNGTFWFGQDSWYSLSSYKLNTTPNQGILVRPPIIRQQEAVNQNISHATQFYVQYANANPGNVWPYYGNIGNTVDKELPEAGTRIRLNASFDVSGFNLTEQHVLNGLKKYGAVITDYTGADYFGIHLEQTNDVSHYNTSIVYSSIPRSAFEFVDESQLMISPDSMQANINIAPTASFTTNASASGITTAIPVQFTDTSTGSYTINAWNWSIENYAITPVTSNTISTSQNFVQTLGTGNYSIALTVTNTQGISNLSTQVTFVNVSPSSTAAPLANFTQSTTYGASPLSVDFADISGNNPTSWYWDFGDGTNLPIQNVTHIYTLAGLHHIAFTAKNAFGPSTAYGNVVVTPAASPTTVTFTSSGTWTAPAGVTSVTVSGIGAGSGGQGGTTNSNSGGAGGQVGGTFSGTPVVSPGSTYTITIGTGSLGTAGAGSYGGASSSAAGSTTAFGYTGTGATGSGTYGSGSAYGGIGAGTGGGTGGTPDNGAGGAGTQPGAGGGGGAGTYSGYKGTAYGGNGHDGSVTITYTLPAPVASFTYTPTSGSYPLTVTFTDTSTNAPNVWAWTFGDGASSTAQNPSNTYSSPGTYNVTLISMNSGGGSSPVTQVVTVTAPSPTASFTGTPTSGLTPLTVQFTDTTTNSPSSWNWTFGDGDVSYDQNPLHTYTNIGNYTVTHGAVNLYGSTISTISNYIIAGYTTPTAEFTANVTMGNAPLNVSFSDASTGNITVWNWTFGDGYVSSLQNPLHTYNTAGNYMVNLTVGNPVGYNITNKVGYITIYQTGSPIPSFTTSPINGVPSLLVGFTDTSVQGNLTGLAYNWSFGDGSYSSVIGSTQHVYVYSGVYSTSLTITNSVGKGYVAGTNQITVASNQNLQNTWWTPHTVQVTLMDTYGMRLSNVQFIAQFNQSSMPEAWVTQMYGIQASPGGDLLNRSLIMSGITGSDGTITFTMLGSLKYDFYLTSATYGLNNYHVSAFPSDSMLNIYVTPPGQVIPTSENNTYSGLGNTSVYVTEPNTSWVNECINYQDYNASTIYVNESWYFLNNDTVWHSINITPSDGGLAPFLNCALSKNVRGTQEWFGYKYLRST
jgi:PKD repeat protein